LGILTLVTVSGCSPSPANSARSNEADRGKLSVLVTTSFLADAANAIGGDDVSVTALMGPGVDPHLYQPTARDQTALRSAVIVFHHGLHLEGRMSEQLESLAASKRVVAVTRDIPVGQLLESMQGYGTYDPHVWFDPALWKSVATTIARELTAERPEAAARFQSRLSEYLTRIDQADAECRRLVETLPPEKRVLLTSHDAFRYLGRAYGFEVIGLQGMSTESEAGLKAITDAVDLVRGRGIRGVFPETSVARAAVERVARDGGAVLGPELYSDSLGPADGPAGDYVGMLTTNVKRIVETLSEPAGVATESSQSRPSTR
jgi:manganese/zinc/iron transport system substrate-binding protein